jgi:hypothetical protein
MIELIVYSLIVVSVTHQTAPNKLNLIPTSTVICNLGSGEWYLWRDTTVGVREISISVDFVAFYFTATQVTES